MNLSIHLKQACYTFTIFISSKYWNIFSCPYFCPREINGKKEVYREKYILCMTAYRCDISMNHTENMSLEIKENNMFIQRMCPKVPQ